MYRSLSLFALLLAGLAAACQGAPSANPRVRFSAPADGRTLSAPVHVTFAAENFTIEPAGEVKAGAGHLHIMVDTDCVPAGTVIPNDESHLHYGKAQTEAEVALAPGPHTLQLVLGDHAHIPFDPVISSEKITITVK